MNLTFDVNMVSTCSKKPLVDTPRIVALSKLVVSPAVDNKDKVEESPTDKTPVAEED